MYVTRHDASAGPRWAVDGNWLPEGSGLGRFLDRPLGELRDALAEARGREPARGRVLAPIDDAQEVWAAGVTYLRSREARMAESETADVYDRVYDADRVEVFFKANGWRVIGDGGRIRVRPDSTWDVPEPSSPWCSTGPARSSATPSGTTSRHEASRARIPLYLPQAKVYNGSCALGPGIVLAHPDEMRDLPVRLLIEREGALRRTKVRPARSPGSCPRTSL